MYIFGRVGKADVPDRLHRFIKLFEKSGKIFFDVLRKIFTQGNAVIDHFYHGQ